MPRWDLVRGGCRNCGTVTCTIVLGWSNAQKVSAIRYAVQQAYVQFSATILQWQYGKAPLSYSRRSVRPLTHRIQRCPLVLHKISIGLLMYGRYRRWRRWRLPRQKIIWTVTQTMVIGSLHWQCRIAGDISEPQEAMARQYVLLASVHHTAASDWMLLSRRLNDNRNCINQWRETYLILMCMEER